MNERRDRILFADGERAARDGDTATARACFLAAAQCAVEVQLWRSAVRCFRQALEIDLMDRAIVARVLQIPARVLSGRGWDQYLSALEQRPEWPRFGCRNTRVISGDDGAVVECSGIGPVLELIMTARDVFEVRPDGRFAGMPSAMGLSILRRALWPTPRERSERSELMRVRVTFDVRERLMLDEHGDWEPQVGMR